MNITKKISIFKSATKTNVFEINIHIMYVYSDNKIVFVASKVNLKNIRMKQ